MSQAVFSNPGNVPTIEAQGQPDNIDLVLSPKGTGRARGTGLAQSGANTDITSLSGTATNDAAAAGQVGEYLSTLVPIGTPVTLETTVGNNVVTLSLTAGDWVVSGSINFIQTGATATIIVSGITTTTLTPPVDGSEIYSGPLGTELTVTSGNTFANKRISLAATTNVRLAAKATFSAGAVTAFGTLTARRAR